MQLRSVHAASQDETQNVACFELTLVLYWQCFTNICCLEDANEVEQDLTNDELSQYDPPSKKILKILRIREIRRRQTIKLFTDLSLYVILLAMVMMLSFQYRNPASYKMINTLRGVFVDPIHNSTRVRFDQVCTPLIGQTDKSIEKYWPQC